MMGGLSALSLKSSPLEKRSKTQPHPELCTPNLDSDQSNIGDQCHGQIAAETSTQADNGRLPTEQNLPAQTTRKKIPRSALMTFKKPNDPRQNHLEQGRTSFTMDAASHSHLQHIETSRESETDPQFNLGRFFGYHPSYSTAMWVDLGQQSHTNGTVAKSVEEALADMEIGK
jgi:hypothetical protein